MIGAHVTKRSNKKPYITERQTTQQPKQKGQKYNNDVQGNIERLLHVLVSHIKNMTLPSNGGKRESLFQLPVFAIYNYRGDFSLNKMTTEIQELENYLIR